MDRVALQAERRIAIFDGHVREQLPWYELASAAMGLSDDAWHHHRCGVSDRTGVNRRRSDSEMTKMPLRSSTSQLLWKRWRA